MLLFFKSVSWQAAEDIDEWTQLTPESREVFKRGLQASCKLISPLMNTVSLLREVASLCRIVFWHTVGEISERAQLTVFALMPESREVLN
jgi:hypothetical protein